MPHAKRVRAVHLRAIHDPRYRGKTRELQDEFARTPAEQTRQIAESPEAATPGDIAPGQQPASAAGAAGLGQPKFNQSGKVQRPGAGGATSPLLSPARQLVGLARVPALREASEDRKSVV